MTSYAHVAASTEFPFSRDLRVEAFVTCGHFGVETDQAIEKA